MIAQENHQQRLNLSKTNSRARLNKKSRDES